MKYLVSLPKSSYGKWSVIFITCIPVCFFIGMSSVKYYVTTPAGNTILEDIFTRPRVAIPMLTGFFSGYLAFIYGLYAMKKMKDFCFLIHVSTAIGFFTILWTVAEIIFPH